MKQNETIVQLLEQASAQLGPCGNEACKFFIKLAIENVEQWESPKYGEVIHNLYEFFCHDTIYSDLLQEMNSAQTEVFRLARALIERRQEGDPVDLADTTDCTNFFTSLNTLIWILRPVARDAEHEHLEISDEIDRRRGEEAEKGGDK